MPSFTDRELCRAQIMGGIVLGLSLLMGITGAACLEFEFGAPEYITCLRNMGWSMLILSCLWTSLATWKRLTG
ncbi:MAG: hypothetical protein HN341_15325 [Verrucomicrobia bacterium]|jgi:hypothetical protein|nr:hypothetical protein [Verrucomicrobiota bacterium]